jgi:hypothetical protein
MTFRQINTLERALSSDANEFQIFGAASVMELFRRLFFAGDQDPSANGGFEVEEQIKTITDPLTAYVGGGLLVNPQGTSLLIDEGTLLAIAPDPVPDARDSVCVVANSPGVAVAGQIPFVANGGAGPRWDILECRPQLTTTTATRDVFDPVTQQFAGQSLDKLVTTSLEFRLRQGVAASPASDPGSASGWVALAAVWTPVGAASFDDCEIFDVRPLVRDLSDFGAARVGAAANEMRSTWFIDGLGTMDGGSVSAKFVGPGRKWNISGRIQATESAEDAGSKQIALDLGLAGNDTSDSRYWEQGTQSAYNAYFHVSLVFPFGLPRWKRLGKVTEAVAGRRWPCGPGGFLVLNAKDHGLTGTNGQVGISNGYDTSGTWDSISLGIVRTDLNGMGAIAEPATMVKNEDGWHFWAVSWFTDFTVDPDPTSLNETFELDPMTRSIGTDGVNFLPATVPVVGIRAWLQSQISRDPTTDAHMECKWYPEPDGGGFSFTQTLGTIYKYYGATDPGGTGDFYFDQYFPYDPRQVTGDDTVQIVRNGIGTTGPGWDVQAWALYLTGLQVQWIDSDAI